MTFGIGATALIIGSFFIVNFFLSLRIDQVLEVEVVFLQHHLLINPQHVRSKKTLLLLRLFIIDVVNDDVLIFRVRQTSVVDFYSQNDFQIAIYLCNLWSPGSAITSVVVQRVDIFGFDVGMFV